METVKTRGALGHHLDAQRIAFAPLMFQAARAARNMGVLAALDDSGKQGLLPGEVAEKADISLYAARILLEACLSLNLVEADDWRFRIARAGRLLLHDDMTRVNMDFVHDVCFKGAFELETSLRERRPAGLAVFGSWKTLYEALPELPARVRDSWLAFDHFYSDPVFALALDVIFERTRKRVLDVGGNTGRFAAACTARDPEVSVTIVDHPGQLAMAAKAVRGTSAEGRVAFVAMDMLDHDMPFPAGQDAVWMSQLLDCFPETDIVSLLRRGAASLAEGGRLYVNETCWDRQRNEVGRYCLHASSLYFAAMANGTSRMYHSEDLLQCIREASLVVERDLALGNTHTLFVCRKEL